MESAVELDIQGAGESYFSYALEARSIKREEGPDPIRIIGSLSARQHAVGFQVETALNATRIDASESRFDWHVNTLAVSQTVNCLHMYAFIDFQGKVSSRPDVYFVPGPWANNFLKLSWHTFVLSFPADPRFISLTKNRWDLVQRCLMGDAEALAWFRRLPDLGSEPTYWEQVADDENEGLKVA